MPELPQKARQAAVRKKAGLHATFVFLTIASIAQVATSCSVPVVWNADVQGFVNDGLSTVQLKDFTVECSGTAETVIPSEVETTVTLALLNPRSLDLTCKVTCEDESLFDELPVTSVLSPVKITFSFTPSLKAEHKDLRFTLDFCAPSLNRTFDPATISLHCNTPPGGVESSLDAALDASGYAFAAFRLPSSATDDDLARLEIICARADGTGSATTVVLPVNDASLTVEKRTVNGTDLLGPDGPLDRYYQPSGISSGDDYLFSLTVVDTEGLRSKTAQITSNATLYTVIYNGNLNTGGSAPVDPLTYRQTKGVTVLGPGTLQRTGYAFMGWNAAADGSGTAYAEDDTFDMGSADVTLFAHWVATNGVTVTFTMNPTYHSITFASPTTTVARGATLVLTTSLPGAAGWNWYVDNTRDATQTTSTFSWNTTGVLPGQYVINVDACYGGYACTGSIRVTVTFD
jgi:uncharacterized repeat protein (TIGR02543 family)